MQLIKTCAEKVLALLMAASLLFVCACSSADTSRPFEIIPIDLAQLQTMMDDKETFVLLVERDNCPFCAALNAYLEETKADHTDMVVYELDTTDYHLMREQAGDMTLVSDTADGQGFLGLFPYFLYTPSLYQIKEGRPVMAGLGYDETKGSVSLWDVDSSIDWAQAKAVNVWGFIKDGQAGYSTSSSAAADSSQDASQAASDTDSASD